MAEADKSVENAGDDAPKHLRIKVKDNNEQEMEFKLKASTPLMKLMKAYSNAQGKAPDTMRFIFDGHRILDTDTPLGLEMEDGDQIQVFMEQQGGAELS